MHCKTYIYIFIYIYPVLYRFYFFVCDFLKTQPGAVSTACAPLWPLVRLTAVIANCPDFKQMHNIRTTIKTRGHLASLTETKSEPAVAAAAAAVTGLADHNSRSSKRKR